MNFALPCGAFVDNLASFFPSFSAIISFFFPSLPGPGEAGTARPLGRIWGEGADCMGGAVAMAMGERRLHSDEMRLIEIHQTFEILRGISNSDADVHDWLRIYN